jgi:uracil phosphoribosyltransferase
MAVEVLKSRGVPEERILFLNLIASPEGIKNFATKFPKLRVVTSFVDQVRPLPRRSVTGVLLTRYPGP